MPQRPDFDLYEALEVTRTAKTQEIRDSYRRLALIHHPDKNPNDAAATERFQRIGLAHEHLSDPDLRRTYDSEDDQDYDDGRGYDFSNFGGFFNSTFFGAELAEMRRAVAAEETARVDREAQRKAHQKLREEQRVRAEEAEAVREARAEAKRYEEQEKQHSKDLKDRQEKALQEKRWSDLNATTEAEKRHTCLHSVFWPKEQNKRKAKCESCGKKSITTHKCPHCSLLACQVCLRKLNKNNT